MASHFHFVAEKPADSLIRDIEALNKFKDNQLQQFITIAFNFLLDPSNSSRIIGNLEDFAEEQGLGVSPLKNLFKSVISILHSSIRRNLSSAQVKEDFGNLGLSEGKVDSISNQWQTNLIALSRVAAGQTLVINKLIDMEWKFGVTAASSELNTVGNTFIQMKLVVNKGGNKTENVYMELSLPEFYSFLHEMERAKSSLEHFS
ncbi:putative COMM domain-containing protein 7 isoform X3 [Apostichopus japonicus]|uniref:Putative COMM domain-containing protein 7 isoform X3 n=1 Tax=Stichopus japonicus TaxID=307972 RepID=A0A2G8K109_STIJA|nr:putative COMM domain-containing protein 7 isoform X3 [Apostichopus japonicus]